MPLVINPINLPDPPDFEEFQLPHAIVGGFFQITGNTAEVEIIYGGQGLARKTEIQTLATGSYNVGRPPDGTAITGIRARSAVAGATAVFGAYFWDQASPTISFVGVPSAAGGGVNSARVRRDTNVALGVGVNVISFTVEQFDNGDMFDLAQPTRLTVPAGGDGKYLVGTSAQFNASDVRMAIRLNGVTTLAFGPAGVLMSHISTLWEAVAGDFFECICDNTSGVGRTLTAAVPNSPTFWATRLP